MDPSTKCGGTIENKIDTQKVTAVVGVVPLLILFNEASVNAFLNLALDFFNLFLRSGIGTMSHSRLLKLRFQFQVHLDHFFVL